MQMFGPLGPLFAMLSHSSNAWWLEDLLSGRCDLDMISINITPQGQHPHAAIQSYCQMLMSCISTAQTLHAHAFQPPIMHDMGK